MNVAELKRKVDKLVKLGYSKMPAVISSNTDMPFVMLGTVSMHKKNGVDTLAVLAPQVIKPEKRRKPVKDLSGLPTAFML